MTGKSPIEWTEQTWNPIVGCSIKSPGCANCYAMKMARRIEAMNVKLREQGKPHAAHYGGTTKVVNGNAVFTGKIAMAPDSILLAPLRRRKPTTYFVNSMGDLFHEDCPDDRIDKVFAVMALAPQHTFQVLTKRADRMRTYVTDPEVHRRICILACEMAVELCLNVVLIAHPEFEKNAPAGPRVHLYMWPLPNVWKGVSTERQKEADERIPQLMQTPAAVRFISAEPLLGPIDLPYGWSLKLDWVIVGGESGPNARPMHPDWARSLRAQCALAMVPFFFKQWGAFAPTLNRDEAHVTVSDAAWVRVGKGAAGRLLDGVTHDAFPQVPA